MPPATHELEIVIRQSLDGGFVGLWCQAHSALVYLGSWN